MFIGWFHLLAKFIFCKMHEKTALNQPKASVHHHNLCKQNVNSCHPQHYL